MLVEAVCMLGAWFDIPVAMEVSGTPELNDLDGWVNIFDDIVYLPIQSLFYFKQQWSEFLSSLFFLWILILCPAVGGEGKNSE